MAAFRTFVAGLWQKWRRLSASLGRDRHRDSLGRRAGPEVWLLLAIAVVTAGLLWRELASVQGAQGNRPPSMTQEAASPADPPCSDPQGRERLCIEFDARGTSVRAPRTALGCEQQADGLEVCALDQPLEQKPFRLRVVAASVKDDRLEHQLQVVRRQVPDAFIVARPRWATSDEREIQRHRPALRRLLDRSADLVVGAGPMGLRELESRAGRWIVYGLGPARRSFHGRGSDEWLAARLILHVGVTEGNVATSLRLYPHRLLEGGRPRAADVRDMADLYWDLTLRQWQLKRDIKARARSGEDRSGRYFILDTTARGSEGS